MRKLRHIGGVVVPLALLLSCDGSIHIEGEEDPDSSVAEAVTALDDFSIAVLPDTQYYSGNLAWVFKDQTSWIVGHANDPDKNIKLVLGLGDIVDGGGPKPSGPCGLDANGDPATPPASWQTQWTDASSAANLLNGHVPYLFAIGNHDYDCEAQRPQPRSISNWEKYFGPNRYAGQSWFNGSFYSGSHANFYNVFTINGVPYLVLALEFYPTDSDLAWANAAISSHASMQTIIVTHAYLSYDGATAGTADRVGNGDSDSAASYRLGPSCPETGITTCGNGNNGTDMWTNLVSKHKNIIMVLNGHFRLPGPGYAFPGTPTVPLNNGVGHRSEVGPLGNRINQVLSDYQGQGRNGYFGNGYLRMYTFQPSLGRIRVKTYSPSVDLHPTLFPSPGIPRDPKTKLPANYKTDAFNEFDLPYVNPVATPSSSTVSFTPADGAVFTSNATTHLATVAIRGTATAPSGVRLVQIYVDGLKADQAYGGSIDKSVDLAVGTRRVTVQAQDNDGAYFKSVHYLTVK